MRVESGCLWCREDEGRPKTEFVFGRGKEGELSWIGESIAGLGVKGGVYRSRRLLKVSWASRIWALSPPRRYDSWHRIRIPLVRQTELLMCSIYFALIGMSCPEPSLR